jgi:hypothetical protein
MVQRALGDAEFRQVSGEGSALILEVSELRDLRAIDWKLECVVVELSQAGVDARELEFEICW